MKILSVLTYYRPHTSGLTIYAERLAKALVNRGHDVTVLTSHYDSSLPKEEVKDGVKIIRVPVLFRVSKGVIMPTFGFLANRLVLEHDAIHLHLPQFDAAGVALRGRILKKPTVITYHCDLIMPNGLLSIAANQAVHLMNNLAALSTHRIVTYTKDYGENSPFLRRYLHKLTVIQPPVELPTISIEEESNFIEKHHLDNIYPIIGMAARFATEKGVEVLLGAMPRLLESYPQLRILFAGPYGNIVGEEEYFKKLSPLIEEYKSKGNWSFVGNLTPSEMAAFYKNINVLVLPSLNSTESFGLVQIEAMINGKPVVASDLPGVRQPVRIHKMGRIIPIGDSVALADALLSILENPSNYADNSAFVEAFYKPDCVAIEYEKLFEELSREIHAGPQIQPG